MPKQSAPRFYFRNATLADDGKLSAVFLIGTSLLWMALFQDFPIRGVAAVWLVVGVWVFFKGPVQPELYIELEDHHVVISGLWKRRIPYNIISRAEFHRYNSGDLGRTLANTAIWIGRLFGGDSKPLGPRGTTNPESAQLTFDRLHWMFVPIPPFLWPKRDWFLPVTEPGRLIDEVNARLVRRLTPHGS